MQKATPAALLVMLPLLAACGDKDDTGADTAPDSPVDTQPDSPVDTGPDTAVDTDLPADPAIEACGDGTAGFITSPELAVHVWASAEPDGDGSWGHPFQDLSSALDATRLLAESDRRIAVWTGEYEANLRLSAHAGDDGTVIQGCGMDEVFVDPSDDAAPVVMVSEAQGVTLEGLCTRGGTRNIQIWSDAVVLVHQVRSTDSAQAGIVVHGAATMATLTDVQVHTPIPGADGLGYGIAIQEGATASISGGSVSGATAVGVFVDDANEVDISDLAISDTVTDASGLYGHGLQVQADTVAVTVDATTFTDNQGAGVFVLQGLGFVLTGSTVDATAAAGIPDSVETTGDGVVISRGDGNINPATFVATLEGNTISGSARAGLLLDGVTAALSSNVLSGNGYGADVALAQDSAIFSGTDDVTELAEEDALELNLVPLVAVDPGSV
jgi:hypothetical protein